MSKIYFTFGNESREGFESRVPSPPSPEANDSVEEIQGEGILERVPNLILFIDDCYRILKPGGVATFSASHYGSAKAWASPLAIRGISEASLNFANKDWREQNKYTEATVLSNFEVGGSFACEESAMQRCEEARQFWMSRYLNVAQAILFTLTKKAVE